VVADPTREFRHFIEALCDPLCVLGFMLLFLFWCLCRRFHCLAKIIWLALISFLLIASTGWLPQYLTYMLEQRFTKVIMPKPCIHWVVVLSGGQADQSNLNAYESLNGVSIKRLLEGIRLYQHLPKAKLILSGASVSDAPSEAAQLKILAQQNGVLLEDIILEERALNTKQQMYYLKAIVQEAPFYLVTSAVHMPRAFDIACQYHLHPLAAPTDFTYFWQDERRMRNIIPNARNLVYLSVVIHELLGMMWQKATASS
tara:strand:- start:15957 stop:16727 length:771 start_codon:yes stop_codon:yes gene_type:complete